LLFANNNQPLREALIVNVRLHDFNVNEVDIVKVRETFLNRNATDLGVLLKYVKNNKERLLIK